MGINKTAKLKVSDILKPGTKLEPRKVTDEEFKEASNKIKEYLDSRPIMIRYPFWK